MLDDNMLVLNVCMISVQENAERLDKISKSVLKRKKESPASYRRIRYSSGSSERPDTCQCAFRDRTATAPVVLPLAVAASRLSSRGGFSPLKQRTITNRLAWVAPFGYVQYATFRWDDLPG